MGKGDRKTKKGKRILGTMTKADDALYERLLKVGVVDSQVQVGESKRLLKDILPNFSAAPKRKAVCRFTL